MKKFFHIMMLMCLVLLICGCKKSEIELNTSEAQTNPDGSPVAQMTTAETTKFEKKTYEYTIPEGAKGPGEVPKVADEFADYPDDKKPSGTEAQVMQILYYYVGVDGVSQDFDVLEGSECTAADLFDLLLRDGVLVEGTELSSFDPAGETAEITLSQLKSQFVKATPDEVAEAVAYSFCENLGFSEITVKCGSETFGPFQYE